ncbi:hypothetical protein PV325_005436 [Microctonus aethiopoides]|nr:hypothetical protein PV325_005436 [Microctonus aethiopoides]
MDIYILISIAVGLVSLIFLLAILSRRISGNHGERAQNDNVARGQPLMRRTAGVRNNRRRMQGGRAVNENVAREEQHDDEEEDDASENQPDYGKIGAKKRAKLEAKAEKKQQREALEKEREERKKKDELLKAEADKQREKDKIEDLKREEIEKKAREEKEQQEYEEYLKIKEAFSVEEEGFDHDDNDNENLLHEFLTYIKTNKVVMLNDLVGHFKLKHESVVERIHDLQANGSLTGVIDDRGKFIYISQEELEAVAKFVKQRGRVSIVELAENSNRLINLNPGDAESGIQQADSSKRLQSFELLATHLFQLIFAYNNCKNLINIIDLTAVFDNRSLVFQTNCCANKKSNRPYVSMRCKVLDCQGNSPTFLASVRLTKNLITRKGSRRGNSGNRLELLVLVHLHHVP